ncbi:glycogen/starch/alpha-glucan phosphorylase [Escherichia coli]|nr:glycogen/starch/alpha-glucan phosphorylase [Escherichia coli]
MQEQYPNDTDLLGRRRRSLMNPTVVVCVWPGWRLWSATKLANGVSELHSNLMVQSLFADFAKIFPGRFTNVTNGVTPRRWLAVANPSLSAVLDEHLGRNWRTDLSLLNKATTTLSISQWLITLCIRRSWRTKSVWQSYIAQQLNVVVNPKALFDVQIKRIHEYKRQLI